jgi:hypothetical protein
VLTSILVPDRSEFIEKDYSSEISPLEEAQAATTDVRITGDARNHRNERESLEEAAGNSHVREGVDKPSNQN